MNNSRSRLILLITGVALTIGVALGCAPANHAIPSTNISIAEGEADPAVWGKAYPDQYASWQKQSEMVKGNSKYGGSVPESYLKESPVQVKLFAGYPFGEDYNKRRGHVYALEDIEKTKRIGPKSVASCWNCKSPNVVPLINQMGGSFWATPFAQLKDQMKHPIACADCHDAKTMELKITRVTLLDALKVRGIDPAKLSRQEMRTMVCAQCHVEYYFAPDNKKVTYPWKYGLRNMPYIKQGQAKISSHNMQSPLNSIAESCQACHKQSEQYLKDQVIGTQDKVYQTKRSLEDSLADAIDAITNAGQNSAAKPDLLNAARTLHRKAQWRWDWVSAGNGMGFIVRMNA